METSELISARYWESDDVDLRLNPRRQIDADGLVPFLTGEIGIQAAVVLATSGSSGGFKFVILSKRALLTSAQAVIDHSGLLREDVSLAALSGFHVGGLGIYARAFLSGSQIVEMNSEKWNRDGSDLIRLVEENSITLTSMTPTHLHDLVSRGVAAPHSLRLVFLGGGRMDAELIAKARELGWPIRVSYGMTEAGSQIATAQDDEIDLLPILPCWEANMVDGGRLAIRGDALFSGYAFREKGKWQYRPAKDDHGWFVTGDRCERDNDQLRFLGRADDLVKVSGELVSLSEINRAAEQIARKRGTDAAVVAISESRREHELVVVLERTSQSGSRFLHELNAQLDRIEAVHRVVFVERLPRTDIGKLDRAQLEKIADAKR